MRTQNSTRRRFCQMVGTSVAACAVPVSAALARLDRPVKIGVIADLHLDIIHDGERRLDAFLAGMEKVKPDALLQLGDFAIPRERNFKAIGRFNAAHQESLHVLGNHDTDLGFSKEQCLKAWAMPRRYYQREIAGLNIVVLDGNDSGSPKKGSGYPSFIGEEQRQWFEKTLGASSAPVIVVSHQPLAGRGAVDNAVDLQEIISRHREKVVMCLNGHTHVDSLLRLGGVPYLHLNSASYYWVGGKFKHRSYPPEIHAEHANLEYTCPYRDPLFSVLTFRPKEGVVEIQASATSWVGSSPEDLGVDTTPPKGEEPEVIPRIRERRIVQGKG